MNSGSLEHDPANHDSSGWSVLWREEDWWAVWIGSAILLVSFLIVWTARPADLTIRLTAVAQKQAALDLLIAAGAPEPQIRQEHDELLNLESSLSPNPAKAYVSKLKKWTTSPVEALLGSSGQNLAPGVLCVAVISLLLFGTAQMFLGGQLRRFACGFVVLFALATLSFVLATHEIIKQFNLEYPLWALLVGLLIANTVGTPAWLKPALRTELYIKAGLVLLGAKILLGRLLALGIPGIGVSWVVTPIVLITTYWFGQRILKIGSRSLNMTISADMSVCGVSAAIATAAACRAKKEELSVAIGLSLMFTVIMMFLMPLAIKFLGLSEVVGGAWLGGTVDATGAVAAAGAFLGPTAESVAITVKMIQNILIGVIAFLVAVYWVVFVEPNDDGSRPDAWEIWHRFPKFVLGFLAASIIFSILATRLPGGAYFVDSMIRGSSDVFRGWFFCLAFVSIGLATNFRALSRQLQGGKPLVLYLVGQTLNLILTLLMAWFMFDIVFSSAASRL